jgi:predicted kinase/muramidase (phage lysozyme)
MTWFLEEPDAPATVPPENRLTTEVPGLGTQFTGSIRKAMIEGDRWWTNKRKEAEILDEIEAKIGKDNLRPRERGDATQQYYDRAAYLFRRAAPIDKFAPEVLGNLPRNPAQLQAEVTKRLADERDDLVAMQGQGNAPWTQMLGSIAGSLDWYDVPLLAVDAPLSAGMKLSSYVGKQALIGAATSVPGVAAEQAQGKRLGFEPADPALSVAAGAVMQGGLALGLGGIVKGAEYLLTRRTAEAAAKADATPGLDHEMDMNAAEEALTLGKTPPAPTTFKPNPALPPDQDPAVENLLSLVGRLEAPKGYDQVYSGSVIRPPRPLTTMTINEVLAWQDANVAGGAASSAAGGFQIIRKTLRASADQLGLKGDELFDAAMQKRIAVHLMRGRGLDDWRAGRISDQAFANSLAGEWAALPQVNGPKAGASVYQNDGLNKALTDPDTFLRVLAGEPVPDRIPSGGDGFTGGGGGGGGGGRRGPGTRFDEISTPAGTRVNVEYQVVDLSSLRPATGDLQPRDRATRVASDEQVAQIAARLDPARLMPGAETDRGAPLVGADQIIESGNGRVQALIRAADLHPEAYKGYVDEIRAQGYDIPEGVTRPVLIARNLNNPDFEARRRVIRESNTSAISRMSASETARVDADYLSQRAFDAYRPGQGLNSTANVPFIRRVFDMMPLNERAALVDGTGRLNADGLQRVKAALFAYAYDAKDLLKLATETENRAVVNLIRMLEDLAPDWSAFRAMVDAGYVRREFDITEALMETARIIARARTEGRDGQSVIGAIRDRLAQGDMFAERDPMTEALIAAFYKGDRARPAEATEDILKRYVSEAAALGRADSGDLAEAAVPAEVLARAVAGADGNTPYAPLPARLAEPPEEEALAEGFDPGPYAEGTAGPAVEAADDALQAELADGVAEPEGQGEAAGLRALVQGGASREIIDAHPAVIRALAEMDTRPRTSGQPGYRSQAWHEQRTYLIDGAEVRGTDAALVHWERQAEALAWVETGQTPVPVRRDRDLVILLGPPAAGKSTIANQIAVARGAAIIDSDEIKKALPEFDGGIGAMAVHEESSALARRLQEAIIDRGTNVILPKVGDNAASIESTIALYRKGGYRVSIVNMAVTPENAYRRMIGRFAATGRLIDPRYFDAVGDLPTLTYREMKAKGAADGYAEIDNNGGPGQPRPVTDRAGDNPLAGSSLDEAKGNNGGADDAGGTRGPGAVALREGDGAAQDRGKSGQGRSQTVAPQSAAAAVRALDEGGTVAATPEGATQAARQWLASEYAAGRLERQADAASPGAMQYRRPRSKTVPDGWERDSSAADIAALRAALPADREIPLTTTDGSSLNRRVGDVLADIEGDQSLDTALHSCMIGASNAS